MTDVHVVTHQGASQVAVGDDDADDSDGGGDDADSADSDHKSSEKGSAEKDIEEEADLPEPPELAALLLGPGVVAPAPPLLIMGICAWSEVATVRNKCKCCGCGKTVDVGQRRWHIKGARGKSMTSFSHLDSECALIGVALGDDVDAADASAQTRDFLQPLLLGELPEDVRREIEIILLKL